MKWSKPSPAVSHLFCLSRASAASFATQHFWTLLCSQERKAEQQSTTGKKKRPPDSSVPKIMPNSGLTDVAALKVSNKFFLL